MINEEQNNFLELKDDKNISPLNYIPDNKKMPNIFDDVEIIIDPELEDESTVDINTYMNKYILQCRICGNMFPSEELLDDNNECPICGSVSPDGFIFKGKLKPKEKEDITEDEKDAIKDLHAEDNIENNDDDNTISEEDLDDENEDSDGQLEINLDTILNK